MIRSLETMDRGILQTAHFLIVGDVFPENDEDDVLGRVSEYRIRGEMKFSVTAPIT